MIETSRLVPAIASALCIAKGNNEPDAVFFARVVYSAIGKQALASLWDVSENAEPVSVVHFKNRIKELLHAFKSLYPGTLEQFFADEQALADEIYNTYLETGFFYHSQYRISPSICREAMYDDIAFIRTANPLSKLAMSGLGYYEVHVSDIGKNKKEQSLGLPQYGISTEALDVPYLVAKSAAVWREFSISNDMEFLRTAPPFSYGYWSNEIDKSGSISLLRTKMPGNNLYYLYRFDGSGCFASPLASSDMEGTQYINIAVGILKDRDALPAISYNSQGPITNFQYGYLLPPKEVAFVKLYSWEQLTLGKQSTFHRVVTTPVFDAIKGLLETKGYTFVRG
jgi:hypothetical protein